MRRSEAGMRRSESELDDPRVAGFTALRPLLFSMAYRMLGTASDVEDVLQEAWLRYARLDGVRDPKAYLVRVVTRLCLDVMDSAQARRERYVGPWLPEPVLTRGAAGGVAGGPQPPEDPLHAVERREQLSLAALAMLQHLSPAERAVLVLREGLDYSHREIADTVRMSEAASRQLLTRARQRMASGPPRRPADPEEHRRLLTALLAAFSAGDTRRLVELLRTDVVLTSDGGGEVKAALHPVTGQDKVVRLLVALWPTLPPDAEVVQVELNGQPALVAHRAGQPLHALWLEVADGRMSEILILSAPSKLRHVPVA
jgi:RNA polymerase sigma-70 factor, ECF subfamily